MLVHAHPQINGDLKNLIYFGCVTHVCRHDDQQRTKTLFLTNCNPEIILKKNFLFILRREDRIFLYSKSGLKSNSKHGHFLDSQIRTKKDNLRTFLQVYSFGFMNVHSLHPFLQVCSYTFGIKQMKLILLWLTYNGFRFDFSLWDRDKFPMFIQVKPYLQVWTIWYTCRWSSLISKGLSEDQSQTSPHMPEYDVDDRYLMLET